MNKKVIAVAVICGIAAVGYPTYRSMFGVKAVTVSADAQAQKIAEFANPAAFITPNELNQLMASDKDVVVIGSLNPLKGDSPISGSFSVWRPDYSADKGDYDFGGMRADKEGMETLLSSFGATQNSTVVVYAANKHHDAARLYWQMKLLGHEDVRYLDGGLNAWMGAGYSVGDANPSVKATNYTAPNYKEINIADYDMVVNATQSDDWVIIDTRSVKENEGAMVAKGAFGPGTIPKSQFITWTDALNKDTTLKTAAQLKEIYGDLIEGKKVISYCQSGVRSGHTTMVLKEVLGAEEVYNYDGSWIEWSYAHYETKQDTAKVVNGNG